VPLGSHTRSARLRRGASYAFGNSFISSNVTRGEEIDSEDPLLPHIFPVRVCRREQIKFSPRRSLPLISTKVLRLTMFETRPTVDAAGGSGPRGRAQRESMLVGDRSTAARQVSLCGPPHRVQPPPTACCERGHAQLSNRTG
jgi:hypothetical protein